MSNLASASANWRRRVGVMERGMPKKCRCGEPSVIKTSNTYENPGRLFHCCPYGSEKDNNHLFKWTDESVVEEIEEMKEMVGDLKCELKDDIGNLELETRTCEAVVSSYEKKIQEMGTIVVAYEKEMEDMKLVVNGLENKVKDCVVELRSLKNIFVCAFGMIAFYYCIKA